MKKRKSIKPRSTRYTERQELFFEKLETLEINVSEWIRAAVKEKMDREVIDLSNSQDRAMLAALN
ncbi:TPA: hypothetical protein ACQVK3_005715 [Serratia marcescens]|uniref:Uncharacterized protein n=1 Tax=Serratia nevei TaxID=2703794 RepID=A0ABT7G5Z9_9GAMM|nr:hypothetical protein [Serratia nevei]MDK5169016.1 hypothetical protein [Serratia nevei]MDK5298510.1 hypothetical protein [Serratia nevei]HAU4290846.1 hypothetical protein [Serratia marcescens]HAU4297500.1 hypothetical protein [Serratia marcescens]